MTCAPALLSLTKLALSLNNRVNIRTRRSIARRPTSTLCTTFTPRTSSDYPPSPSTSILHSFLRPRPSNLEPHIRNSQNPRPPDTSVIYPCPRYGVEPARRTRPTSTTTLSPTLPLQDRKNTRSRLLLGRERMRTHRYGQVLRRKSHQQTANGRAGTYGKPASRCAAMRCDAPMTGTCLRGCCIGAE